MSANDAVVPIPRSELAQLFPKLQSAHDNLHGWAAELDAQSLRLNVPAKNFRLITLR